MPLRLKGKSATRFCLFPKPRSANYGPGDTPVYLNVYDLTPMNGYAYWAGLGIFHSGVEGKVFSFLSGDQIIKDRLPFAIMRKIESRIS